MINYQKPIIAIAGLTASGKSFLSLKLAKDFNGYIINADSRQIYKELKIGTAQPKLDKIKNNIWYTNNIRHFLYGQVSIKDNYNLFRYQQDVQRILDKEEGLPILVGGTGLYIDSIIYNYDLQPLNKRNTDFSRKKLEKMDIEQLQSLIEPAILDSLNNSDRNNPIRLIRTIERRNINYRKGLPTKHLYLFLDIEIKELEDKIKKRIKAMFKDGLLKENKRLIKKGYNYEIPAMQSIGYQEFEEYFKNNKSLKEVESDIILHTLQYAKRQRTWFRKNKEIRKIKNYKQAYCEISNFLSIS